MYSMLVIGLGRFGAHQKLGKVNGLFFKALAHTVEGRNDFAADDVQRRLRG